MVKAGKQLICMWLLTRGAVVVGVVAVVVTLRPALVLTQVLHLQSPAVTVPKPVMVVCLVCQWRQMKSAGVSQAVGSWLQHLAIEI